MRREAMRTLTVRKLLNPKFPSTLCSYPTPFKPSNPFSLLVGFNSNPLSTTASTANNPILKPTTTELIQRDKSTIQPVNDALLKKLRIRRLKGVLESLKSSQSPKPLTEPRLEPNELCNESEKNKKDKELNVSGFRELGLREEVMNGLEKAEIEFPSEIQTVGIPSILKGKSVVLSSSSGSGRTLAYLLPLIQLLKRDEELHGVHMKPNRPRAVVLCRNEEKSVQAFCMADFFTNDVKFRPMFINDEGLSMSQEDAKNISMDMIIGTPGGVLQYIEEKNMSCSDIRYLVLDEVNMFGSYVGPQVCKFIGILKNCASKSDDPGFQAILVTVPMTEIIGDYPILKHLEQNKSGEVAAMLLEIEGSEVIQLIVSPNALKKKIGEAMNSL